MATWFRAFLSAEEQTVVRADLEQHSGPVVRRKLLILWAVHLGHARQQAADLAAVGLATAKRFLIAYRDGGLDGLTGTRWHLPTSELAAHAQVIQQSLTEQPVRIAAEAATRIEQMGVPVFTSFAFIS